MHLLYSDTTLKCIRLTKNYTYIHDGPVNLKKVIAIGVRYFSNKSSSVDAVHSLKLFRTFSFKENLSRVDKFSNLSQT